MLNRKTDTGYPFSIVVGFDFSDEAHLALDHAFAIAEDRAPAFVHVLAVLETGLRSHPNHEEAMQIHERVAEIAGTMRETRALDTVTLLAHARIGKPADTICLLAEETSADMIVVGTHGRTGAERWILGSVAERVARNAPCPVLVARATDLEQRTAEAPRPEPPCPECATVRNRTMGKNWWCAEHRGQQPEPTTVHVPPRQPGMPPLRGVETKPTAPFGPHPSVLEQAGRDR